MTANRLTQVLTTPDKKPVYDRILAADLDDDQTYVAELLLAMANDKRQVSLSNWVAVEMFELAISEWRAVLDDLVAKTLVTVDWDNTNTRAVIIFTEATHD